jgi:hypothetical protein
MVRPDVLSPRMIRITEDLAGDWRHLDVSSRRWRGYRIVLFSGASCNWSNKSPTVSALSSAKGAAGRVIRASRCKSR